MATIFLYSIIFIIFLLFILFILYFNRLNIRIFYKGNIEASGTIKFNKEVEYFSISIGTQQQPISTHNDLYIKLKNNTVFCLKELTEELFEKICCRKTSVKETDWPINSICYGLDGYSAIFANKKLIKFNASIIRLPNETFIPEIGCKNSFYKFPITEKQLTDLFGVADRVKDYHTN